MTGGGGTARKPLGKRRCRRPLEKGLPSFLVRGKTRFEIQNFFRVVSGWGKEFRAVKKYIEKNTLEALGVIPYQTRKSRYNAMNVQKTKIRFHPD